MGQRWLQLPTCYRNGQIYRQGRIRVVKPIKKGGQKGITLCGLGRELDTLHTLIECVLGLIKCADDFNFQHGVRLEM